MDGIVSLLDSSHDSKVATLWQELEHECGLVGIAITPIPHFSWQVAVDYNVPLLKPVLQDIASRVPPFNIRTAGIGVFSGERPVLYIPIVKNEILLQLHKMIWEKTLTAAERVSPYYAPAVWIPHITLAHGDVVRENVSCAMERLIFRSFNWEVSVNSIALISQADGGIGEERLNYPFTGSSPVTFPFFDQ